MFKSDVPQILKCTAVPDGRLNEMENMDIMLQYDNNEFMSSDFFDTIRAVEDGIQDDFLSSPTDDFNTSSDASSNIDGNLSPMISESERSSEYTEFTDESVSPLRSMDTIDETLFDFFTPLESKFEIQSAPVVINQPKSGKIIIQNPHNKKIVNKQIINSSQIKKIGKKQVVKVQSLTANGKPVILPYGLKSIKIVNASDLKTDRIHVTTLPAATVCRRQIESTRVKEEPDIAPPDLSEVKLTSEEKRLLDKEGIQLPAYHPLTKMEDRELKRIRRKIRNKISAQDSRKRKKEYVDGLEERVWRGAEENRNLMQRVKELQKKNKTLMAHINRLQSLIFKTTSSKATPSTCLMIVMLSVLLVSLPNIRLSQINKELSTEQEQVTTSRSLLSTKKPVEDDTINMEEFFIFNKDEVDNENNTDGELLKTIEEMESKYENVNFDHDGGEENLFDSFMHNLKNLFNKNVVGSFVNTDYGGFYNRKGFIEPDIDEYDSPGSSLLEPPTKKMKLVDDYYHQHDENFVPLSSKVVAATMQTVGKSEDK